MIYNESTAKLFALRCLHRRQTRIFVDEGSVQGSLRKYDFEKIAKHLGLLIKSDN